MGSGRQETASLLSEGRFICFQAENYGLFIKKLVEITQLGAQWKMARR